MDAALHTSKKRDLEALASLPALRERVRYCDDAVLLLEGRWQDVIERLPVVDAVITDPPYSERTHGKQRHGRRPEQCNGAYVSARGIGYHSMSLQEAHDAATAWAGSSRGWVAILTDSELAGQIKASLRGAGLTDFAPLPVVMKGMNVRLAGDGPSSWSVWLVVARPKSLSKWGTLDGAYVGLPWDAGQNSATATRRSAIVGGKPLWLMRAIVRDYSREGDLVLDPCAGGATTLLAARLEGRRCIGVEMDPETCAKAAAVLQHGRIALKDARQGMLDL